MRIVAGAAGGRRLSAPPGRDTRPTSDRAREALFASVETLRPLQGLAVLDLFAGSGALGIEAVSRGASRAVLVERDRRAAAVARVNARCLGTLGDRVEVRCVPVERLVTGDGSEPAPPPQPFGLLLADPPYAYPAAALAAVLATVTEAGWLAPDAVAVMERATRDPQWEWPAGWTGLRSRRYGEATLWYGARS